VRFGVLVCLQVGRILGREANNVAINMHKGRKGRYEIFILLPAVAMLVLFVSL
jgi:hypothetical protein